jgi:hypothetical protein
LAVSELRPTHNSSARTNRKHRSSIVVFEFVAAEICLPSRVLETNVVTEPFAGNGCFSGSTVFALKKICHSVILLHEPILRNSHYSNNLEPAQHASSQLS